jgi:hypothetical protein
MFKILPSQMEAFNSIAEDLFMKRLLEHFRQNYPDTILTLPAGNKSVSKSISELEESQLREILIRGVSRARNYGLTDESSIGGFAAIMLEAAPNFDEHPVLQETLSNTAIAPSARVGRVLETFTEEILEAVRATYNPNVWTS